MHQGLGESRLRVFLLQDGRGLRAGLRMWNPRWISLASDWTPGSRVSTPESSSQVTVIALLFLSQGWIPRGVASQKNRSDAGDVPGLAPHHTFSARKEPENNGLTHWPSIWLGLDPGSDSGVHHGIHPEPICAGDLPHAPLPSISNSYASRRRLSCLPVSRGKVSHATVSS